MKRFSTHLRVVALFVLITQTTSFASIQTPRSKLHLIETIIFSHGHAPNEEQEAWDIDVKLSYDCKNMVLDHASDKISSKTHKNRDKNTKMLFDITDQTPQYQYVAEEKTPTLNDNNYEIEINTSSRSKHKSLLFLSDEFHDLTTIKERLRSSKHYEVLFHESWTQVLTREKIATPIVIDSPKNSSRWPRIQGTISLFMNNFIHFKSNIWINVGKEKYTNSMRLKPPPILTTRTRLDYERANCLNGGMILEPPVLDYFASHKADTDNEASDSMRNYDWSYAIPVKDTQKIKINHIHYVDHPLIGIILKITNETE